jgi:predicted dehydrogenase
MGAAAIAHEFVTGAQKHTAQQIVAVASRTPGKAAEFAKTFGLEHHDNYEGLLARPDIDVIYIPTLPTQHHAHALQAIAAGKHVLIEKPITMDAAQAEEIFAAARAKGVFAMEAMWTRYLPQYDIARQLIENKTLGEIQMVNTVFCSDNRSVARLWNKGQGNPLIDMGIYSISFLQSFLGEPTEITAQGVLTGDNIDQEISVQLRYASGARGYILSSAVATLPVTASVSGSKGHITMGPAFLVPSQISISDNDFYFETETWHDQGPAVGHNGLGLQATYLAKFVSEGLIESPYESHADSVANIRTALKIMKIVGVEPF